MEDFEIIRNQIIAGTAEDRHGERYSKEFFQEMIDSLPSRMPLHQQHLMSKQTSGYLENFKIVPHEDEWVIVADVFISKGSATPNLNGFSFSATKPMSGNIESSLFQIFLPFPHYNNKEIISDLMAGDPDLMVGKWIKKGLNDLEIGLIASAFCLIVSPEWDMQYKQRIRPSIEKLFKYAAKLKERNIPVDLVQQVDFKGQTVQLYFIPERKDSSSYAASLKIESFDTGYAKAINAMFLEPKCSTIGVTRIKLIFNSDIGEYKIFHIQFADGTDINIA